MVPDFTKTQVASAVPAPMMSSLTVLADGLQLLGKDDCIRVGST
jgi:hypothetical protein